MGTLATCRPALACAQRGVADEDLAVLADLRAGCSHTTFDLVKVQEKSFKARPILPPSASGWYGWCEYR
jgi:hypothetical protein